MSKAVRFNEYGGADVLRIVDVETPAPGPGEVAVRVKAAGINPGEASIREGLLHHLWPATFPISGGVLPERVGRYRIHIPSKLAYGATPPPGAPIPPNADLDFDVHVVDIVPNAGLMQGPPQQ